MHWHCLGNLKVCFCYPNRSPWMATRPNMPGQACGIIDASAVGFVKMLALVCTGGITAPQQDCNVVVLAVDTTLVCQCTCELLVVPELREYMISGFVLNVSLCAPRTPKHARAALLIAPASARQA